MNDRLITLLGALCALLIAVGLFFQPGGQPSLGKPNTEQRNSQGYYAMFQWLERSRVPVVSLRERLTELDRFSNKGNILMITLPVETALRSREIEQLRRWIAKGNTLLLFAALNDTPSWTNGVSSTRLFEDLEDLTQLRFETLEQDEPEDGMTLGDIEQLFSSQKIVLSPSSAEGGSGDVHPLLRMVDNLQGTSDGDSSKWRIVEPCAPCTVEGDEALVGFDADTEESQEEVTAEPPQLVLNLAIESGTQAAALWELQQGEGRVLLSAVSGLFSNRSLGSGGNAQLLTNIVAWHLGSNGQFIVDDLHQGLSVLYDPAAFYKDPRLEISVLFLLVFWLIYIVGTNNRLAPVVPADNSPQQGQYIAAVGGFMSRKLAPADTALLLFDRWFSELDQTLFANGLAREPNERSQEVWQRLLSLPTVDPTLAADLQQLQAQAQRGEMVNLQDLHNQLQQMRNLIG